MHLYRHLATLLLSALVLAPIACKPRSSSGAKGDGEYEGYEGANLTPDQERGRRIWYEATGDNGRFHTYIVSQKFGAPENWWRTLGSANRDQRWGTWGMIPDPDCTPGSDGPPSYGFDICKGDQGDDGSVAPAGQGYQGLLDFVGKTGYKDPGCWVNAGIHYNEADCALGLGTSTGALGFRKFPNPRFDANNWPGWEKYEQMDGSIEPPFLIGTSCGQCHIAFNPLDPPADPNHPQWRNIKGLIGNQFENISEIIASGADPHSIEWQAGTNARIGTVDTSAHPTDMIYNPGTPNAIINLDRRPPGLPAQQGEAFKSFDKQMYDKNHHLTTQRVFNILKGGEDDVGGSGAINRVYINIGTCAEPCWMNHLIDNRTLEGRGSQQTPFSIAQCMRDCPAYRALDAHYDDFIAFFTSRAGRPTDLKDAVHPNDPDAYKHLVADLGEDKVKLGRHVYAKNCASCHSSQKAPEGQDQQAFLEGLATEADQTGIDPFTREENGVRVDWLGSEEREPVTKIGTIRCRSLHSNHMRGHIWDEFSSETYKNSPTPPGIPELEGQEGGGRGYYRDVSLLSVWTQAPFMHNNAVGPELCNKLHPRDYPCVDKDAIPLADGRTVSNVTVEGRLKLFEDSMDQLLNPEKRGNKISRLDQDVKIPVGLEPDIDLVGEIKSVPYLSKLGLMLKLFGGQQVADALQGYSVTIPKGTPVTLLASLDYRKLAKGIMDQVADPNLSAVQRARKIVEILNAMFREPDQLIARIKASAVASKDVYSGYTNCTDVVEDKGHEFGASLSQTEKDALIAFMKTL